MNESSPVQNKSAVQTGAKEVPQDPTDAEKKEVAARVAALGYTGWSVTDGDDDIKINGVRVGGHTGALWIAKQLIACVEESICRMEFQSDVDAGLINQDGSPASIPNKETLHAG